MALSCTCHPSYNAYASTYLIGHRCHGSMWACASPASAGTLRTTGATPSTTCTGGFSVVMCQMCVWGGGGRGSLWMAIVLFVYSTFGWS